MTDCRGSVSSRYVRIIRNNGKTNFGRVRISNSVPSSFIEIIKRKITGVIIIRRQYYTYSGSGGSDGFKINNARSLVKLFSCRARNANVFVRIVLSFV